MPGISDIGEVMQLGYVPDDFDAALDFWIGTMGAGPFYVLRANRAERSWYRGAETDPELTVAIGHWGEMQIELIRQDNDAPSPYREWPGKGLHHVCILTDDIDRAKRITAAAGGEIVFGGEAVGAEWFYAEMGSADVPMVEVLRPSEASTALVRMIRDAARDWDGSDPIRDV